MNECTNSGSLWLESSDSLKAYGLTINNLKVRKSGKILILE